MSKRRRSDELTPRNASQKELLVGLENFQLTFAIGPAGTGKTYVSVTHACLLLKAGVINKIVVTRPMVEAEEHIGFLPGDANEKFAPYFAPIREIMDQHFPNVDQMVRNKQIEIAPFAFMRGRTFNDAFVLLDEAQNTTPKQMKLFLTRLGDYSRVCVSGDLDQVDIEAPSGLLDAVERHANIPEVKIVEFDEADIVRSKLVKKIIANYR
jgi:phosphate starvation-inducible protein PhoH and related proteins